MTEVEIHNRLVRIFKRKARLYNGRTMRGDGWVRALQDYHEEVGDLLEDWQQDMKRRGVVK